MVEQETRTHGVIRPFAAGIVIGAFLGVLNLVDTARHPLADDDAGVMLVWVIVLVTIWTAASLAATWTAPRIVDAIKAGTIVGCVTIAVFHAASIVRVNVFLNVIRDRADWQNLLTRYSHSGFGSLRAYA